VNNKIGKFLPSAIFLSSLPFFSGQANYAGDLPQVPSTIDLFMAADMDKDDFVFLYVEFQSDAVGKIDGYRVETFEPAFQGVQS
jgi:hypothetical protein